MISVVDYGVGNLGSILNMLKHLNVECHVITTPAEVLDARKLILPGVGSWDNGIQKLRDTGIVEVLNKRILIDKIPILGICLGMQLILDSSEEGTLPGLGWISGEVKKFDFAAPEYQEQKLRIPHMGWNVVDAKKSTYLTEHFEGEVRFYFVHSYHAVVKNQDDILMTCNYGYPFTCAIQKDNIWGVQFHPEKSHKFGMTLMKKFSEV